MTDKKDTDEEEWEWERIVGDWSFSDEDRFRVVKKSEAQEKLSKERARNKALYEEKENEVNLKWDVIEEKEALEERVKDMEEEVRELKRENRQLASIENDVHNEDQYYPTEDMIAEDRGPPEDKDEPKGSEEEHES